MATHVNYSVIVPDAARAGKYSVAIVRGVEATGNPFHVVLDFVAGDLALEDAATVARAAPHIERLNPNAYVANNARPPFETKEG